MIGQPSSGTARGAAISSSRARGARSPRLSLSQTLNARIGARSASDSLGSEDCPFAAVWAVRHRVGPTRSDLEPSCLPSRAPFAHSHADWKPKRLFLLSGKLCRFLGLRST